MCDLNEKSKKKKRNTHTGPSITMAVWERLSRRKNQFVFRECCDVVYSTGRRGKRNGVGKRRILGTGRRGFYLYLRCSCMISKPLDVRTTTMTRKNRTKRTSKKPLRFRVHSKWVLVKSSRKIRIRGPRLIVSQLK